MLPRRVRILVCTTVPVDAGQLAELLGADGDTATVRVVVPALNESALAHWVSDPDEAIEDADVIRKRTVAALREAGVDATGETGESEPLQAIEDAMGNFSPERILVVLHHEGERKHKEDDLLENIQERFNVPAERAELTDRA